MPDPGGRPTVVLIPPSCCGAGYFRPLRRALGDRVTARAVELPGRGHRYDEPRVVHADSAVADLDARIGADVDVIYGESLGAYLGLAVLSSRDRGADGVVLVAASNSPPSARSGDIPADLSTGERVVAALRTMGGEVPPEVLADTDDARDAVSLIRDDLHLSRSLATHLHGIRVAADIVVLAGRSDPTLYRPASWAVHTSGSCMVASLQGGHLLSAGNPAAVADAVAHVASRRAVLCRPAAGGLRWKGTKP
ncbi:thioesterase II family protein [Pseudonocardia sp. HH130629-09]|uniref:thioesterase II family protein n=1 Tax=Pseudonocardia sp. HH130629-09 TaxID=1641402 RepID=UPI0009E6945C|nr:alpha/beta fold hydrolase [Pseudonocardia sp. HH130629-09]